ncbi:MAG: decaprenyl-phosphate phosphoribosyltransferase [Patescibacteria group bacterium]|nr:decaprenyl-phosphate phosphoribosyltransferase [Patescibacteria group bacterium]
MKKFLFNTLRLLRPRQWIKNLAIFAAITFSGHLFELDSFEKVFFAFVIFCALSSGIYIVNDLIDIKKDRLHPFKKYRPIANKQIPPFFAGILSIILISISFLGAFFITPAFLGSIIFYLILQISYSLFFKNIAVLDILVLAAGYILRVYAGEFATGFHISVWLLLTIISMSLFIAVGKRRSELTLILGHLIDGKTELPRKTLSNYSERLLDIYASIFATSTFISYSLFTFLESPSGFKININILMPDFLPTFFQRKWLMITIAPVVYGIMRYLQNIYEKHEGESPERVILSDLPLLSAVIFWVFLVVIVIYFLSA